MVAIQRLTITEFIEGCSGALLLDVRSPAEYKHAHIPAAVSLPLFSDGERKLVGTTYKQKSREDAIKIGLDLFAPKMRKMVEEVELLLRARKDVAPLLPAESESNHVPGKVPAVFVYCWRGGMRSAAVAWLLDLYGYKVFALSGGYKAFRNFVLNSFELPFSLNILGGFTGSGKTEVLHELKRQGEVVVDLERIASHKGSAFGSFKMPPQPTQEMFENILAMELRSQFDVHKQRGGGIWMEDESQRIGDLNLPNALWDRMREAPLFFLDIPFEERLDHIVQEYGDCDIENLVGSTERISQRLGGLDAKNAIGFLRAGQIREAFEILLKYYDKRYVKGLHNRNNISALLTKIQCDQVTASNAGLLRKPQPV